MASTVNIEQFKQKVDNAINEVASKLPELIDAKGLNSIALMKNRFIQQGETVDSSGNEVSFPAYSESYKKRKDKVYGGTPNRLVGLGSKSKNVSGGDMLRKLSIVSRVQSGSFYSIQIGGSDDFAQQKIDRNSERYGDIMNLSVSEVETLSEVLKEELIEIFNNALE
jgi:hypothetical protein